jgi:hypothetical protein
MKFGRAGGEQVSEPAASGGRAGGQGQPALDLALAHPGRGRDLQDDELRGGHRHRRGPRFGLGGDEGLGAGVHPSQGGQGLRVERGLGPLDRLDELQLGGQARLQRIVRRTRILRLTRLGAARGGDSTGSIA